MSQNALDQDLIAQLIASDNRMSRAATILSIKNPKCQKRTSSLSGLPTLSTISYWAFWYIIIQGTLVFRKKIGHFRPFSWKHWSIFDRCLTSHFFWYDWKIILEHDNEKWSLKSGIFWAILIQKALRLDLNQLPIVPAN